MAEERLKDELQNITEQITKGCLLYTSDAADEL